MKKMTTPAEKFRVPVADSQFGKFSRKFREHFEGVETTGRYRAIAYLAALAMAALNIWMLAANAESTVLTVLLMIPSAAVAAVTAVSLFRKNRHVGVQLQSAAALFAFLELMRVLLFVRGDHDLLLFSIFGAIILAGAASGIWRWGIIWVNMLAKDGWIEKQKKKSPVPVLLITSIVVTVVRAIGHNAMYVLLVVSVSAMCAMLGYAIGISSGNVRFMRWLDRKKQT